MDAEGTPKPNIKMSSSASLDAVFNQIISYVIRDYIYSWYAPLTADSTFPTELHRLLQQITANTLHKISRVDWTRFLTEVLPTDAAAHIRLYRMMLQRQSAYPDKDPVKLFFDCEVELEKTICRETICLSREAEQDYLRKLSETFLFLILPGEEYRVPAIRYIARAKDSAFTSEYFIQALRMSDSVDELKVVMQQVVGFMEKLRGHDSGGDGDAAIKAQLGSLEYVRKVCEQRMKQIEAGVSEKPDTLLAYHLQPGMRLHDMSFKEVMATSVGLVSFLGFLTSIDKHELLRLYLNSVDYRKSAQSILDEVQEINSSPSINSDLASVSETTSSGYKTDPVIYSLEECDQDSSSELDTIDDNSTDLTMDESGETGFYAMADTNDAEDRSDSPKVRDTIEDIRAGGVVLCNNLLKQLPTSVEPMVQCILRNLTTSSDPPDPDAFAEVEDKLSELLSDVQCFGAFKRSPQYVQLLAELDLLKDPAEINSPVNDQPCDPPALISSKPAASESNGTKSGIPESSKPTTMSTSMSAMETAIGSLFGSITDDGRAKASSEARKSAEITTDPVIPPSVSVEPHVETYTPEIIRTEIMHDSYVIYTIKVMCTFVATGHTDTWHTLRRFSHIAELHSLITDRCGNITRLKLPPKRAFSNMSRDFLTKRRRELNEYLTILCNSEFLANYPQSRPYVIEFLQPDSWERGRLQSRGVSSIFNPLRSVGNAMKSMPDTLVDGFSRMLTNLQPPGQIALFSGDTAPRRSASFDMSAGGGGSTSDLLDGSNNDESPIEKLFLLVDEMFNLQQKNYLSRESNFVTLRKIFQAFFGPRVNKKIISKAKEMLSSHRITEFLAYIRDTVWPPTDPNRGTAHPGERDNETKLRTRVLCRTMMLGSVSDELAQFLGNETTRHGVSRLFKLLQDARLNRRFVHYMLETLLYHIFQPYRAHLSASIEKHLCPEATGRYCRVHSTTV